MTNFSAKTYILIFWIHNDEQSFMEVEKINSFSIKEALKKIKPNKSDTICNFSSDFLINGPDILIYHLEVMIKSFLLHGHVSEVLLKANDFQFRFQ